MVNITSKQALIDKDMILVDGHNNNYESMALVNQLTEQLSILSDQSRRIIMECMEDIKLLQVHSIAETADSLKYDTKDDIF